jgi:hypothetical protein
LLSFLIKLGEYLWSKNKSDVHDLFKSFVKRVQNEFETTIKKIRSDNGSEFKSCIHLFRVELENNPSTHLFAWLHILSEIE